MIFGLDSNFTSWGPFINHDTFIIQPVTRGDLATAIVVFAFCIGFAASAAHIGYKQTVRSREPWKSAYIWMVWLEWASCLVLAIECMLFLVRVIRPSFWFFFSICEYNQALLIAQTPLLMIDSVYVGHTNPMSATNYHQSNSNHSSRSKERAPYDDLHLDHHVPY
jgi:hypothetical protein